MKIKKQASMQGVTLIEILLVLVIASSIIYGIANYMQQRALTLRIDRMTLQTQQILNAGLAYYVTRGSWPGSVGCLRGQGGTNCVGTVRYLPTTLINNPWGSPYTAAASTGTGVFYVYSRVTQAAASTSGYAASTANIVAGRLPLAYTTSTATGTPPTSTPPGTDCGVSTASCAVVASVNIPGQNLNNASAMNFAGIYRHGGCIPVPQCPVDATGTAMTPQVFVVPISVSGVNDPNDNNTVYPISSFTAYARGPASIPPGCYNGEQRACGANPSSTSYWRACLQIITEKGDVSETRTSSSDRWGQAVTLGAFTRCRITNEPSGSTTSVYTH